MKDWKKQEQKKIEQNKKDIENLRREIGYRISSLQDSNVVEDPIGEIYGGNKEHGLKDRAFPNGYSNKYRGATKEQYEKVKKSTLDELNKEPDKKISQWYRLY